MKHILIFDESDALRVVHLHPDSQSVAEGKTEYFAGGCIRYEQIQTSKNQFVEPIIIKPPFEDHIGVFDSAVLSNSVLFVYPKDSQRKLFAVAEITCKSNSYYNYLSI